MTRRMAVLWCTLAASVLFAYACLLANRSITGFATSHTNASRWPFLGDKPVGEDGFYMLTVAQNLAATGRLIYTHGIPATGIQPLSTIVFGGIAVANRLGGGNEWTLIRWIVVLGAGSFLVFGFLVAELASQVAPPPRRDLVFCLAFFLTICDFSLFRLFTYGLESGLYLCCISLCLLLWRRLVVPGASTWRDVMLFGVAGGAGGLCRIDFGVVFAILLAWLLIKRNASFTQVVSAGFTALVIVTPWFAFIHSVSGSWLPSSGKAESLFISGSSIGRLFFAALSVMAHLAPWTFSGAIGLTALGIDLASLALLTYLIYRAPETRAAFRWHNPLVPLFLPWALGCAALIGIYVLWFWSTHFYFRYFGPIACVWIPVLALVLSERPFVARRPALVLIACVAIFAGWDVKSLHTGHVGSSQFIAAGYVHAFYPNAIVGSYQSGTIAYFNPQVVNLDGKLNPAALQAETQGKMPRFLETQKVSVLVDWPGYLQRLPGSYLSEDWQPCPQPMPTVDNICLARKPDR